MLKKYIKTRTVVEAMQWNGTPEQADEIIKLFDCLIPPNMPGLTAVTQYGMEPGDWMVTHKAGQQTHIYVVKKDIFPTKYKLFEAEAPKVEVKKKAKEVAA